MREYVDVLGPDIISTKAKTSLSPQRPEVVFFDAPNGEHVPNVASSTDQLQPQMSTLLNDLVTVIRVLRRSRTWIPFDVGWYKLPKSALSVTEY